MATTNQDDHSTACDTATVRHAHTGAWVAHVLRERIAAGQLTPGQKLSEQSLAGALGVSRNTLREAFTALAGEAVITRIPNRGVFVASPDACDVREIYSVRRMIEPAAVLWGDAQPQRVDAMERIVEQAVSARAAGAVATMADSNQALHEAVIGLAGSQSLCVLMERVLAQMRLVFHAMASAYDFHSHYVDRNVRLVELIRAGRRDTAASMLRDYLDDAEAELLQQIAQRVQGTR